MLGYGREVQADGCEVRGGERGSPVRWDEVEWGPGEERFWWGKVEREKSASCVVLLFAGHED